MRGGGVISNVVILYKSKINFLFLFDIASTIGNLARNTKLLEPVNLYDSNKYILAYLSPKRNNNNERNPYYFNRLTKYSILAV
jgi:hypothetical protein